MECLCANPRNPQKCENCSAPVCKKCAHFLQSESFAFSDKVEKHLRHARYCVECFESIVQPALTKYDETMSAAKEVYFIPITYRGSVNVLQKHKEEVTVKDCIDRRETIMRLAFKAVELGYNSLVQGEVNREQVRNHAYQSSLWHGKGLPVNLDIERMERHEFNNL